MALSQSVTYLADAKAVWRAVVRLVHAASYPVVETAEGDRRIVYQASGGSWASQQTVRVSVTSVGDDEVLVTAHVAATTHATLAEGTQQRKLLEFVFSELDKKFEKGEEQAPVKAPGTSGCAGAVLLFVGFVLSRLA